MSMINHVCSMRANKKKHMKMKKADQYQVLPHRHDDYSMYVRVFQIIDGRLCIPDQSDLNFVNLKSGSISNTRSKSLIHSTSQHIDLAKLRQLSITNVHLTPPNVGTYLTQPTNTTIMSRQLIPSIFVTKQGGPNGLACLLCLVKDYLICLRISLQ